MVDFSACCSGNLRGRLKAFELGNEINSPNLNGDFSPAQATSCLLGFLILITKDPEGHAIAIGYLKYLQVMAHSRMCATIPDGTVKPNDFHDATSNIPLILAPKTNEKSDL